MPQHKQTDILQQIWNRQKKFQKNFYDPDTISEKNKIAYTKEFILCIHRELGEVLNIIPWKLHRKNNKKYDIFHLREELIDCFKYLLNICLLHGMTAKSFQETFFKKSKIVETRYEKEKQLKK